MGSFNLYRAPPFFFSAGIGGNDANTQLLIHADGADASTTFTDVSQNTHTVTAAGNAQVDTAQSQFGGASALFDGTGDYLSIADAANIRPGSGDFTWDYWIRYTNAAHFDTPVSKGYVAAGAFALQTNGTATPRLIIYDAGVAVLTETAAASLNTWYHYAIVRSSGTFTIYRDGTANGTVANTTNFNSTAELDIGGEVTTPTVSVIGNMDEIRFSNVARYTSDFTPATGPYD